MYAGVTTGHPVADDMEGEDQRLRLPSDPHTQSQMHTQHVCTHKFKKRSSNVEIQYIYQVLGEITLF